MNDSSRGVRSPVFECVFLYLQESQSYIEDHTDALKLKKKDHLMSRLRA